MHKFDLKNNKQSQLENINANVKEVNKHCYDLVQSVYEGIRDKMEITIFFYRLKKNFLSFRILVVVVSFKVEDEVFVGKRSYIVTLNTLNYLKTKLLL